MIVLKKQKQFVDTVFNAQLTGALNGINKVFYTPDDYRPGSITLLCNGQTLYSPEDFEETDSNEIKFKHFAPLSDYVIRATYEINWD